MNQTQHPADCKCDACYYSGQGWAGLPENQPRLMAPRERAARLTELDGSGPLGLLGIFAVEV